MKQYQLNRNQYIKEKQLTIERLEFENIIAFEYYEPQIISLINHFNKEYKWDGMFNFDDVQNRIIKGHLLFILYCGNNAIGYMFYEPKDNNEFYLYNLYVTNCIQRPSYSANWFVDNTIKLLPNTFSKITCVCEDWHTSAHNVFKSNGFTRV
jgi:hypothetical protein